MACVRLNSKNPWNLYTTDGSFGVTYFAIIGDYDVAFQVCGHANVTLIILNIIQDIGEKSFGIIVLAIYALIAQIILVNLLIGTRFNYKKRIFANFYFILQQWWELLLVTCRTTHNWYVMIQFIIVLIFLLKEWKFNRYSLVTEYPFLFLQ